MRLRVPPKDERCRLLRVGGMFLLLALALEGGCAGSAALRDAPKGNLRDLPSIAVFKVQSESKVLTSQQNEDLTEDIRREVTLALEGRYKVMDSETIMVTLDRLGKGRNCLLQDCFVQIAEEVSADYSMTPRVRRVGGHLDISIDIYDVRTKALLGGAKEVYGGSQAVKRVVALALKKAILELKCEQHAIDMSRRATGWYLGLGGVGTVAVTGLLAGLADRQDELASSAYRDYDTVTDEVNGLVQAQYHQDVVSYHTIQRDNLIWASASFGLASAALLTAAIWVLVANPSAALPPGCDESSEELGLRDGGCSTPHLSVMPWLSPSSAGAGVWAGLRATY